MGDRGERKSFASSAMLICISCGEKTFSVGIYIYIYIGWLRCNRTLISIASVFREADLKSVIIDRAFGFGYIWATLYIYIYRVVARKAENMSNSYLFLFLMSLTEEVTFYSTIAFQLTFFENFKH